MSEKENPNRAKDIKLLQNGMIRELIQNITEARQKRVNELKDKGASPEVVLSFMIGSNYVISRIQHFYETGETNLDESIVE